MTMLLLSASSRHATIINTSVWKQNYGRIITNQSIILLNNQSQQQQRQHQPQCQTRFRSTSHLSSEFSKEEVKTKNRPVIWWERMRDFPKGVMKLYQDLLQYKNIHDASRTRLNAWTLQSPLRHHNKNSTNNLPFQVYDDEIRPGKIPRRQHEEQRRLMQDLRTVLPVVLLSLPPIIGYLPLIFAVACPRQVLSRQFLNPYEIQSFATTEYKLRRGYFGRLGDHFWNSVMINVNSIQFSFLGKDAAGPLLDIMPLYAAFSNSVSKEFLHVIRPAGSLASLDSYPREYLVTLALASGINQSLPNGWNLLVTLMSPSSWLRTEIRRVANDLAQDDELLLEEGHDQNGCESLTDLEVMDACLMRGLPVTVPLGDMRQCLVNHLEMILKVKTELPNSTPCEGFKLFTLHLSALRHHLKMNAKTK